eukprot:m.52363 g.52363  ORF g.52363 m.52363 type:complete len:269 (-) comp12694_c0_seq1:243-1049(-)
MSDWDASNPSKRYAERFFLSYSPVWMLAMAVVVYGKVYEMFTAESYLIFGICCAAPAVLWPLLFAPEEERALPLTQRYWFKANVWSAIFSFIGHHFLTHYFYNVLGAYYTVPQGYWINGVPLVMFFLTHVYFLFYHTLSSMILRKLEFWSKRRSLLERLLIVGTLAYITAVLEAWSISAFPHYKYPNEAVMLSVGSLFYAMMFLVTFPAYSLLDEGVNESRPACYFAMHALACGMLVFILDDAWRLIIGPVHSGELATQLPYAQSVLP